MTKPRCIRKEICVELVHFIFGAGLVVFDRNLQEQSALINRKLEIIEVFSDVV